MGRVTIAAMIGALALPIDPAAAQERSFACEGGSADTAEVARRTDNFSMQLIMDIYASRWDASYVRTQCEAFASGEPHTITCIADVRDWDAIEASIPDDYYGMDRFTLAEFVPAEREAGSSLSEAYDYCRDVGAIR